MALLALCLIAALPWLGLRLISAAGAHEPVYALAALETHLASRPAAWLHRSLRVRALLGGQCTEVRGLYTQSCSAWRMALTDPGNAGDAGGDSTVQPLPLAWGTPSPYLAFLRRLPMVRELLPPPQILHSGVPAVYRISVQPTGCVLLADPPCYEALMLDGIPPDDSTDWVRIGS